MFPEKLITVSPVVHAFIGWLCAIAICRNINDRRMVVVAGVIADIDGLYILYDVDLFLDTHHTWGHTFLFGLPVAAAIGLLAEEKLNAFVAALSAYSLHLFADIVGTDWAVSPLYPVSDVSFSASPTLSNEMIYVIIGPVAFLLVMLLVFVAGYRTERSPVEFFSEKWDRAVIEEMIYPLKYRCEFCDTAAVLRCRKCGRRVCGKHKSRKRKGMCGRCGKGGLQRLMVVGDCDGDARV
jgi:hypothetical protein